MRGLLELRGLLEGGPYMRKYGSRFLASLCQPGLGFEMVKGAKHATDFSGHVNLAATIRTNFAILLTT